MAVRRWWYVVRMALDWMESMAWRGRRGRRRRRIADAFNEPVCVSKAMIRWTRRAGSMGETMKSGSLDQG